MTARRRVAGVVLALTVAALVAAILAGSEIWATALGLALAPVLVWTVIESQDD